jgi:hypothetical protein
VKLKHIVTKRLIGRKIKPFVNLTFHGLLWKLLETFIMKILTLIERVCLSEINFLIIMNLIKLIYTKELDRKEKRPIPLFVDNKVNMERDDAILFRVKYSLYPKQHLCHLAHD